MLWLPGVEIAPTAASRTQVDRPIALVDAANTASPVTYAVHVDRLNRPIKVTSTTKASVWTAVWKPWGEVHAITGTLTLDSRFPGQWFQIEVGLHYNWHRHYDPTLGRYTQPDPLGFVDGPGVYEYARGGPQQSVDPDGQYAVPLPPPAILLLIPPAIWCSLYPEKCRRLLDQCFNRDTGGSSDAPSPERCSTILRGCRKGCTDVYVDRPWDLPGSGQNLQPRFQRCVKNCMAAHNCPY